MFLPSQPEIQYSWDFTAWKQHILGLHKHHVSVLSFWHYQEILPRAQPCTYVCDPIPNSRTQSPAPLPLVSVPTLLKDLFSPTRVSGATFLALTISQNWSISSQHRKEQWGEGNISHGILGLVLLVFSVSWAAGWQPGPCWVQSFFWIYSSDIPHVSILPISFLVRKKKMQRQKWGHKSGMQLNEDRIKVKKEKRRN